MSRARRMRHSARGSASPMWTWPMMYDAFSMFLLAGLEALGLLRARRSGRLRRGRPHCAGGSLPCNTSGTALSWGYMQGFTQLTEGVRQMRGEGGATQVRDAESALVTGLAARWSARSARRRPAASWRKVTMETLGKPTPLLATEGDRVYWSGVREHRLLVTRCRNCGIHRIRASPALARSRRRNGSRPRAGAASTPSSSITVRITRPSPPRRPTTSPGYSWRKDRC